MVVCLDGRKVFLIFFLGLLLVFIYSIMLKKFERWFECINYDYIFDVDNDMYNFFYRLFIEMLFLMMIEGDEE